MIDALPSFAQERTNPYKCETTPYLSRFANATPVEQPIIKCAAHGKTVQPLNATLEYYRRWLAPPDAPLLAMEQDGFHRWYTELLTTSVHWEPES